MWHKYKKQSKDLYACDYIIFSYQTFKLTLISLLLNFSLLYGKHGSLTARNQPFLPAFKYSINVRILILFCGSSFFYADSNSFMRIIILLCGSSFLYADPHSYMRILILLCRSSFFYADPHYFMCIIILLCGSSFFYVDPHSFKRILILLCGSGYSLIQYFNVDPDPGLLDKNDQLKWNEWHHKKW